MVRVAPLEPTEDDGSPHVRGDGPERFVPSVISDGFSPRAWGWSEFPRHDRVAVPVLPTCVGMVRSHHPARRRPPRSPHVRGDGPGPRSICFPNAEFSPRAWGWSATPGPGRSCTSVLPTCVGMVRHRAGSTRGAGRSPHVRGDGPGRLRARVDPAAFSPRAWGWSDPSARAACLWLVLPTCVGMVRARSRCPELSNCSPHVRGDGPMRSAQKRWFK